jgi:hypothetical protein
VLLPLALGVLLQAAPFAPMEYPGADPALGERIRTLCPLPTTLNRAALVANEERLAARVRDARRSVTGVQWRELACGRALLQSSTPHGAQQSPDESRHVVGRRGD